MAFSVLGLNLRATFLANHLPESLSWVYIAKIVSRCLLPPHPLTFYKMLVITPNPLLGPLRFFFFLFFGRAAWLVRSQFPDQGLNLGPGSKSPES